MQRDERFQPSPYGELVGTELLAADPAAGTVEVAYDAHDGFTNRIGTVAGAMIAGLLDSVTGIAGNLDLPDGHAAVHRSLAVEYLRPVAPGRLVGRGRIDARDAREVRSRGELYDADGTLVASGTAVLRIVPLGPDGRRA